MPITPAHAAAAPLIRRILRPGGITLPFSALAIGTQTPDFQYLIRLNPGGGVWHTLPGLLTFCLPVGLAVWCLWRLLIGPALIRLLPPGLGAAAAAQQAPGPTIRLVPGAALAILLGALSHDLWDSFTHEARWGVREFPSLDTPVPIGAETTPLYWILQVASSVVGVIIVGWIIWRWVMSHPAADRYVPPGDRAWRIREATVLLLAGVAGGLLNASRTHVFVLANSGGLAAVGGMSALAVALLVYGVVDVLRQHGRRSDARGKD